jgi:hypothetical protein
MKIRPWLVTVVFLLLFMSQGGNAGSAEFILEVWDKKGGEKLLQFPIQVGDFFYLKTIHSLALTPYTHIYKFDDEGNIILSGAIFESGGGGYPVTGDGVLSVVDGKFRMDQMNRFVGKLRFRVSPVSQETFSLGDLEIPLYKRVPEGTLIEISISKGKE